MINKDLIKIFVDEIYGKAPKKNYETKKIINNHIDEIWSIDLAVFSVYKTSNNKGYRYTFVNIDNFLKFFWAIPLKIEYSQTITNEFSNTLTTSKRKPLKKESDRCTLFKTPFFRTC